MSNIYNAIQNLYNMDKTTWQEVLAELYNLVSNVENKFDLFENKFGQLLGKEVTKELKKMYDDGSLASLINDKLLKDIKTEVDAFKKNSVNWYNVSEYGVIMDGKTDNTIALQTLIDNIDSGVIYFPAGVCLIKSVKIKSNMCLLGDGIGASVIKRINGIKTTDYLSIDGTSLIDSYSKTNQLIQNFRIENLTIDGNKYNTIINMSGIVQAWHNISIYNGENIYITNCEINNSIGNGINLRACNNSIINNCRLNNCGYVTMVVFAKNAITVGGSYTSNDKTIYKDCVYNIQNCYIDSCTDEGIYITNVTNCTVDKNHFKNIGEYAIEYGSQDLASGSRVSITNNTFDSTGNNCINLDESLNKSYIFIQNNIAKNIGNCTIKTNDLTCRFLRSTGSNNQVEFSGNTIEANSSKFLQFIIFNGNINIINNKFIFNGSSRYPNISCLYINQNSCVDISNNTFSDQLCYRCIQLSNQQVNSSVTIKDNNIINSEYGIYVTGTNGDTNTVNLRISNNNILANKAAIYFDSDEFKNVNICNNCLISNIGIDRNSSIINNLVVTNNIYNGNTFATSYISKIQNKIMDNNLTSI